LRKLHPILGTPERFFRVLPDDLPDGFSNSQTVLGPEAMYELVYSGFRGPPIAT
jgi:hypothetical protein